MHDKRKLNCVCATELCLCRLSYPLWMLDKISVANLDSTVFVMYDTACSLSRYLQVCKFYKLEWTHFNSIIS